MNLEFIYFDVGGVLIFDLSGEQEWHQMRKDLGAKDQDLEAIDTRFMSENSSYTKGEKDLEEFVSVLRNEFSLDIPQDYSLVEDMINRFKPNPDILPLVTDIQNRYRTGLFTNTYTGMTEKLRKRELIPNLPWEIIIDSSEVGYKKPQEEIYKIAQEKAKAEPDKILFIENTQENLDTAKNLGWNTFLYDPAIVDPSNQRLRNFLNL